MTDTRPAKCRFRMKDEGKFYPRSGCKACGRTVMTGLGTSCHGRPETTDTYGPWIGWNGGDCPVDADTVVEVVPSSGACTEMKARNAAWTAPFNLIAYRVRIEPVTETRKLFMSIANGRKMVESIGTIETIDGVPVLSSIKLKEPDE